MIIELIYFKKQIKLQTTFKIIIIIMDNFFSSLYEFDFDIVMNKLNLSNKKFFSIHETKMVLFYLTGKKIKKLEIMQKLNEHYSKKK